MKYIKRVFFVIVTVALLASSLVGNVSANDDEATEVQDSADGEGKVSGKDEVIYATLSPAGEQESLYVVNRFDVDEPGTVVDYGNYTSVRNLTNLNEIVLNGDEVQFTATDEEFYYQGNMEGKSLPWSIDVTYVLNGKEVSADELAGQEGQVEIQIETSANEEGEESFFENYMLQLTVPLDTDIFSNIQAKDGMIANAGKTQQVTFTVMPEKEERFVVEADTSAFEFGGIEISGVPSSMSIDEPDTDDMTGDMRTLSDAIGELNDGVAELQDGIADMNDGADELVDGSASYRDGISELDASSGELVAGSQEIELALNTLDESLRSVDEVDTSQQDQLVDGLNQLSAGLTEMKEGLSQLKENYAQAYQAMDAAMNDLPSNISKEELEALGSSSAEIDTQAIEKLQNILANASEEELAALAEAGLDKRTLAGLEMFVAGVEEASSTMEQNASTIGKLVNAYEKSQIAKGTYFGSGDQPGAKAAFDAVDTSLEETIAGLDEMASNVDVMANEISSASEEMDGLVDLQEGIAALANEYGAFHSGLNEYTNGVSELSNNYGELHSGVSEFANGIGELETGVADLQDGTEELYDSTKDLPEEMTSEIDEMISQYDKSDFDPVSFVSDKNENVNHVQFVMQTESIEVDEPDEEEPEEEESTNFWEKFKALFS